MDYHSLSIKEVLEKTDSKVEGLSQKEVDERLVVFGKNKLKKKVGFDALKVFLGQFKSFLILILIFAAVLSFFMESVIDAVVIFAIIILNAGLGFFQEYKASKAIDELRKIMVSKAKVLRGGKIIEINSENLVPGDILILREGDKIMADARVFVSEGLKISEASLTGESTPVDKVCRKLGDKVPLAERINMVYQGTEIVAGSGRAIVVETGIRTELGEISELVQEIRKEKNPFKDKLDRFARKIGVLILILCGLIVLLLLFKGFEFVESFLVTVSLAVAAIPEGLPAIISLGLALATSRMIKRNVLIRKLPASETLGRTTVIASDKTGTLTEEEMKVLAIYTNGKINPAKGKDLLFKIGVLCNNAVFEKNGNKEYFLGDPTEIALIKAAKDNFLDKKELEKEERKVREFAFSSEKKMMSVVRKSRGGLISYVKGAPEKIIERCDYELVDEKKIKLEEKDKKRLIKFYEELAKQGLRVLGFAYRNLGVFGEVSQRDAEEKLIFVGFQGMIDPPRPEVKNAIQLCKEAGIKVLMITGDSKLTADAIAKEIGLEGRSVGVEELEKMSDKQLYNEIKNIGIFARISPKDKLRIISILKQKNEIVAMTGDGVNDALALKRADIGVSMGIRGTDVARDASDIVLVDDNFASIVEGVREGRTVYDNIRKFVKFLLSANFSEVLLVLTVILIWKNPEFLPLLPLQILWINLITDSLPALALSVEPTERDVMKRKPSKQNILSGMKGFILFAGLLTFLVDFMFFYWNMADIDKARTMVVTASVVFEMFLVFNCKSTESVFKSRANKHLFYAVGISILLQVLVVYTPLNSLFYFVPLKAVDWLVLIGAAIVGFFVVEGWKMWERRKLS